MVRFARALTFTALLLAVSMLAVFEFRGPGGRGDVDIRQSAADAAAREVRVHADAGVARPPAAVERAPGRRGIGIVCRPAGTGVDQPSRRARSAAEGLDAAEELRRRRLLRQDRRRGAQEHRPGSERPDVDGERDPACAGRCAVRRVRRAGARSPEEGHRRHRAGEHDQNRTPLRRGAVVSGQRVLAVPVQEIHRRAPGVRARTADCVFRRRSGQLHVSALRLRHGAVPRLREQRPGGESRLFEVVRQRRRRRRAGVRVGPPRLDRSAVHRRAARDAAGRHLPDLDRGRLPPHRGAAQVQRAGRRAEHGRRRGSCSAWRTRPKRTKARLRG